MATCSRRCYSVHLRKLADLKVLAEIRVVPGFERTSFAVITASVSRVDFAPVYLEKFDLDFVAG